MEFARVFLVLAAVFGFCLATNETLPEREGTNILFIYKEDFTDTDNSKAAFRTKTHVFVYAFLGFINLGPVPATPDREATKLG